MCVYTRVRGELPVSEETFSPIQSYPLVNHDAVQLYLLLKPFLAFGGGFKKSYESDDYVIGHTKQQRGLVGYALI